MDVLVGLLIVALGSLGQSSSYVPINKIQSWSWESFWLVQGIFAWLVFPLLGTFLALPEGIGLMDLFQMEGSLKVNPPTPHNMPYTIAFKLPSI